MPSLMLHIAVAHRWYYNGADAIRGGAGLAAPDPLFWVGSVAPDAVYERADKDRSHLRSSPNRAAALAAFAAATDPGDPFAEAALLHLFVDWKWDDGPQREFIEYYGDGWFRPYREEIGKAGAWLYHNMAWSRGVWAAMTACAPESYRGFDVATPENIQGLIERNVRWYEDNARADPGYYGAGVLSDFTERTAAEYRVWRARHGRVKGSE